MRRPIGLRRRPTAARNDTTSPATSSDSSVDPPIVATLVQPLLELRASLGTGVATPSSAITGALSSASTQAADTEGPHRDGVHALESTWTGPGSDAAVPALRTTQTQIGDISDRGPAYLGVLADAHATSARAAGRMDRIIADFRRDARTILGNATAAPDTDAVINRATQALRDAITTVTSARTEMDDHSRRLDEMGPLTVTTPAGLNSSQSWGDTPGTVLPSAYGAIPGQYGTVPAQYGTAPGQPIDPAQLAQLQLQQLLVQAGVQVGTSAINAGVDIGTHLIDKIAEVGTHTIDTVASSVDQAIPQLINPDHATGDKTNPAGNSGDSAKLFDFGPGKATPGTTGPGSIIPGGPAPDKAPADKTPADKSDPPPPSPSSIIPPPADPAPMPKPPAPAPAPAPAPEPAHPGGVAGGMALPPPAGSGQDHKPRDGQLGVTVPAAETTVPAAVIGDFGDDTV
ncbi:hypothetical protein IU429_04755 [Nocardia elegans]|uniref:Uncharacterized protein n=2 Tax=Nocardia TaxID=1817 RepID=A0A2T2Z1T4_9NOCA|nr:MULTISPECIES: hypothetical protein [Nocardia]MBF6446967.1 hypothetical protein [Nocardia elegans]PSR61695.1 hypothetical protein C8259_19435 [Nocardia nova]